MKIEATRRQIVGAAGITMVLAACAKGTGKTETQGAQNQQDIRGLLENGPLKSAGSWPPYGKDPMTAGQLANFHPQYVKLVWLEADANWDISTTHATYELDKTNPAFDTDQFARNTFSAMKSSGKKKPKFKDLGTLPLARVKDDVPDLKRFGCNSQQIIYFYFSSEKVEPLTQFELDNN